ncbi:MAG: peptidoglycan-binding protein [Gammaproteobacteria bacterium]|nr:peptidoglycan-binding protein [Gammaproteobacteria bacterium]
MNRLRSRWRFLRRRLHCVALTASLVVTAATAGAADRDGSLAIEGAGLLPCAVYVREREQRSNVYYMVAGWVEGFVTAHNKLLDDTFDVTSFESLELLLLLIDQHCAGNPEDRLYPVVNTLLAAFNDDRLERASATVDVVVGNRRAVLYAEVVRRVQQRLADLGHYDGATDGAFGPPTQQALAAFQQASDLEPSGFPDQTTLWRLLRRAPDGGDG